MTPIPRSCSGLQLLFIELSGLTVARSNRLELCWASDLVNVFKPQWRSLSDQILHPVMRACDSQAPCAMTGAFDDIVVPWSITEKVDYEGELALVIGKPGRAITRAKASEHVWAYTIVNDVTARDLQARHKQWLLGKSIDTFCPIGPWLTSVDEVDPCNMQLSCWVNGELRQHANTRDLIFDIPAIIESISASMTLQTGDIIATGTPAGVGIGFDPPKFLRTGDVIRVAIEGLGAIENTVR